MIGNSDPLPRALSAGFGRAATVDLVEHVEDRLEESRESSLWSRFVGRVAVG